MRSLPQIMLVTAGVLACASTQAAPVCAQAGQIQAPPASCAGFAASCALPASELGTMSGGQEVTVAVGSSQTLTATNTGNSVTGQTIGSGDVNLQKNAFAGYSGIGNFVINTGHNNNLQGSISVNIATVPPR